MPCRRLSGPLGFLLVVLCLCLLVAPHARAVEANGQTRALVVGVDAYAKALRGAVADARDIADTLGKAGAQDVTLLLDAQASHDAILKAAAALRERTQAGDLIVIAFAGLGTRESANGDRALLLAGAVAPLRFGEIKSLVRELETAGAQVLVVTDANFGLEQTRPLDKREQDQGAGRAGPPPPETRAPAPQKDPSDQAMPEKDFARTIFLFAAGFDQQAPEIRIPDLGWRGALSYAFARSVENARRDHPEQALNLRAIVAQTSQIAYQISDGRQNIVMSGGAMFGDAGRTRTIKQVAGPGMPLKEANRAKNAPAGGGEPLRVAALDGRADHFAGLAPLENSFVAVAPNQSPEMIWDQTASQVIVGGDVIAYGVQRDDIPAIVDRVVAVRALKRMTAQSPQTIILAPGSSLHHQGTKVAIEIEDLQDRALLLFDITGDGTVQLLYPIGSDPPIMEKSEYKLELMVTEPYGADQIVAITAPQRMSDLEQAFNRLKDRKTSGQIQKILARYAPAASRVGSVGLFTAP